VKARARIERMNDFTGYRIIYPVKHDGRLGTISPYLFAERLWDHLLHELPGAQVITRITYDSKAQLHVEYTYPEDIPQEEMDHISGLVCQLADKLFIDIKRKVENAKSSSF
jgi:hypothetical protein